MMHTKAVILLSLSLMLPYTLPLRALYDMDDLSLPQLEDIFAGNEQAAPLSFDMKTNTAKATPGRTDEFLSAPQQTTDLNESLLTKEAFKNTDLFGPAEEKKDVYLNFEGAELKSFIEYIADLRGMNIIPDKSIAGNKISLNFRNPVSKTGAWNAFLTVLEMANFSMIKVGDLYRVVTKDKKFRLPLPVFIGVSSRMLPDSDATIRYIALFNNVAANDVRDVLQSMLSPQTSLIAPPNINGFIITDCSCTIKAAMQVIEELDQTGLSESVFVMPLKRVNARDVKALFDNLITKPEGNPLAKLLGKPEESSDYFTPGTKLIAEERTNKLIMLGQRQSLEKIKSFIVENIDTELKQAKSPLRIYELQNASVTDVAAILNEVTNSANASSAGQQAARYGAIRDGVKYFKSMTFQADKEGNRLLVSCTDENDWKLLVETIKKLDTAQPQVAVQMLIVTISATSMNSLGGQARNPTHGITGGHLDFQTAGIAQTAFEREGDTPKSLLGNILTAVALGQGSSVLSLGKAGSAEGIWGVLKALKTDTDATVLSQPFAVAANCSETSLVVGESTYIVTETTGGSGTLLSGKSPVNANTTIRFTPQVNSDGIIRLKISADIKEFVPDSGNSSTQTKNINTVVTVANGQVLVMGGFVKTKITDRGGQTPILGSIPVLGWLAKNLTRSVEKEYVFLFLCPTILKPRTTPGIGMYSKINLHRAAKEVEEAIQTTKTNDPIHNWFFNSSGENYSHKVIDFANARYQPNNVDIRFDPYYRSASAQTLATSSHELNIDTEAASPLAYAQTHNVSTGDYIVKPAAVSEPAVAKKTDPVAEKKPKLTRPPATKPTTPEKVTITPPPADTLPISSHASAAPTDELEEKRSKLRTMLSRGSLSTLLQTDVTSSDARSSDRPPTQPQEAEKELWIGQEAVAESTGLQRRSGIQQLLAPTETAPSAHPLAGPGHHTSNLHALFGGA